MSVLTKFQPLQRLDKWRLSEHHVNIAYNYDTDEQTLQFEKPFKAQCRYKDTALRILRHLTLVKAGMLALKQTCVQNGRRIKQQSMNSCTIQVCPGFELIIESYLAICDSGE